MTPVALPHPDDFARLTWHQRDKAIRTARALLRAYGAHVGDDLLPDGYRPSAEARRRDDIEWGRRVRDEARRLAGAL